MASEKPKSKVAGASKGSKDVEKVHKLSLKGSSRVCSILSCRANIRLIGSAKLVAEFVSY